MTRYLSTEDPDRIAGGASQKRMSRLAAGRIRSAVWAIATLGLAVGVMGFVIGRFVS